MKRKLMVMVIAIAIMPLAFISTANAYYHNYQFVYLIHCTYDKALSGYVGTYETYDYKHRYTVYFGVTKCPD